MFGMHNLSLSRCKETREDTAYNRRPCPLLARLSRPTYAFTAREASENERRGESKSILEKSARTTEFNLEKSEFPEPDTEADTIKTSCQSMVFRGSYIIV